jgi:hypothetical protein
VLPQPAAGGVLRHVVGGRYGLGSKDFTPAMAKAVYDNLKADKPKDKFTVRTSLMCAALVSALFISFRKLGRSAQHKGHAVVCCVLHCLGSLQRAMTRGL